ncbi:hypothetical protein HN51_001309 [Arachis hypogaea]|uniref:Phosphatidylinositol 4-phosphate 5-kinase n=1 Tax=Arachis hypogaea TaxID=3818 RepID=A0A445ESE5_ARAHY|nr:uncharacterized protein LOC112801821 isoform X1 [Arachis hypogaea]QHO49386.1 Phosphatidylinositol 4-phosphate 5-kinase [Arachis hypogaea]RYR78282.1 hypothetical protein Ahy_A01g003028 [Arachis hypogaea]
MHKHHQKSELQFEEEESLALSTYSSSTLISPPNTKLDPQTQTTSTIFTPPSQTHQFAIQISPFSSSCTHNPPTQQHHEEQESNTTIIPSQHEHQCFFPNMPSSSSSQSPLSSPHKRPIMNTAITNHPSSLSPSQLSPPRHNRIQDLPFQTPFGAKFQPLKLLTQPHFRFLIFLSIPSLYFLLSNPTHRSFFPLDLFYIIIFSALLLLSLNLALPRLPSIRLFLARSLPTKLSSSFSTSNTHQPVLWSIGSNPRNQKIPSSGFYAQIYSNGDVYEGEFHKGKCSGSGVYHYHMSGRYEGDWVDGRYDGYGVETWARGSRYRGMYRQGLRHGVGIYRSYSGDVYAGEWFNGQCHGFGVHTCNDGSKYVGEFKWGVKHGIGQYHFRNGDFYAGEYFADMMHGFGVYQFQNGHRYEGAWHEGRRQGLGSYTFRNGETQCGHWQNGILDDLKMQNNHTASPCAVDQAKVFNAVNDAHSAAEKAHNLAKVDVGVNKVVASANKSANAARVAAIKAVQNRMHHNNK